MCTRVDLKIRETVVPTETEKRSFKLPKIELKKFSGEAKDFLAFWSQFQKIHNDKSIAEEDKMQYLLQSVEPKSKAERLVLSFPATAENYPKAIDQLKERFGREDLLVQIYVRELLNLVMKNAVSGRTKTDLSPLYDELEGKLRSLESLGRTQEKYGDFLTPLVESCLPEEILAAVAEWYRYRTVACFVTGSSPVPLKTRRVGQRCTLNLSRAETSSRWCGVVVRRGGCQLRCRPRHLTMVQNYVVRRQKPSCS
ncbi:DUF1758 domain-containing protein [Trichonephila clavipes]|nr:DUF1758 domain-containing protein [Trichonephila clavipes]